MDFQTRKTLKEQRFERLKDTISEYLDDEGQSSQEFLDDMERALLEMAQYFRGRADAYAHIQRFFK